MNRNKFSGAAIAALLIDIVILTLTPGALAQSKFKTLYAFTGSADGSTPYSALIFDPAGNLYGTTNSGGVFNEGTVFELSPNPDGTWTENVLYSFCVFGDPCADGANPNAGLIFDGAGNLYGTTVFGGTFQGTLFKLTPNQDGTWTESVPHSFAGGYNDGSRPYAGLIFDRAGNLYGTASFYGGPGWGGIAFELTPNADGSWTENLLYAFCSHNLKKCYDGYSPLGGLIFDQSGNLYGTAAYDGRLGNGVAFRLTSSASGWTETVLHAFNYSNGYIPAASLIFDQAGNLYGTTFSGGPKGQGLVFQLTPNANGSWKEKVLHQFVGGSDGGEPDAALIFDQTGNLYGTTQAGGAAGYGVVFRLTPLANGGWKEKVLHQFANGSDGSRPHETLTFDAAGSLYGTTAGDGITTFGSVFEITP
jgi:uncharacterized repeat protein (TIGR03803 family)